MQEDERQVAVGGVFYRGAGCLLLPLIPVRAAGALIITTKRIIFDPILYYKLVTRRVDIDLEQVSAVETGGSNVEFNLVDIIRIGKALVVKLKSGKPYTFRSTTADQLADSINQLLRGRQG